MANAKETTRPRQVRILPGEVIPVMVADVSLSLVAMTDKDGERPETILVLRKWSCGFEACTVLISPIVEERREVFRVIVIMA